MDRKKGLSRDTPIFINLKSNTMKNTLQIYSIVTIFATFVEKKCLWLLFINMYFKCVTYKWKFVKKIGRAHV